MNELRQFLDSAIGEPPPSRIDLEALIGKQRRLTVVRRWSAVGAVVAAVLGISLVIGMLSSGGRTPPVTPSPSPTPQTTEQRLGQALRAALTAELPGTRFLPSLSGKPFEFRPDPAVGFSTDFNLADVSGVGQFVMVLGAEGSYSPLQMVTDCALDYGVNGWTEHTVDCAITVGPDGERVVTFVSENRDKNQPTIRNYRVTVTKPDGTTVGIWSRNWCSGPGGCQPQDADADGVVPTRPEVPISIEQMIRVALHPGLTLRT